MKNKSLLLIGAALVGVYFWDKKKKEDRAAVVNSAEHSNCSGCNSNATGDTVYYTNDACSNIQNNLGVTCEQYCTDGGGTWDAGDTGVSEGSGWVGACTGRSADSDLATTVTPTREKTGRSLTPKRTPMFRNANGWGANSVIG